jgi:hypothetical protein
MTHFERLINRPEVTRLSYLLRWRNPENPCFYKRIFVERQKGISTLISFSIDIPDRSRSKVIDLPSTAARPPAHQEQPKIHSIDGAVAVHISRKAAADLTPLHQ